MDKNATSSTSPIQQANGLYTIFFTEPFADGSLETRCSSCGKAPPRKRCCWTAESKGWATQHWIWMWGTYGNMPIESTWCRWCRAICLLSVSSSFPARMLHANACVQCTCQMLFCEAIVRSSLTSRLLHDSRGTSNRPSQMECPGWFS